MKIAYIPFLMGNANLSAKELENAIGRIGTIRGFEFPFHLAKDRLDSECEVSISLRHPTSEACRWGADVLIGHSLGAFSIVANRSLLKNRIIFLIDGGFDGFSREELLKFNVEKAQSIIAESNSDCAITAENFSSVVKHIAEKDWNQGVMELSKTNSVFMIVSKPIDVLVAQQVVNFPLHRLDAYVAEQLGKVIQNLIEPRVGVCYHSANLS